MTIEWPRGTDALLAWTHLLVIWAIVAYAVPHRVGIVYRVTAVGLATGLVLSSSTIRVVLAMALSSATMLVWLHWSACNTRRNLWIEVGAVSSLVLLSAIIVADASSIRFSLLHIPISHDRLAAVMLASATILWLMEGGTGLTRALLTRVDVPSDVQAGSAAVQDQLRRGQIIGNIERPLLAGAVAAGSYEALAFLIAAKGLIRSKELEQHQFAEYFLIGTLSSTAVALVAGGLLRAIFIYLW